MLMALGIQNPSVLVDNKTRAQHGCTSGRQISNTSDTSTSALTSSTSPSEVSFTPSKTSCDLSGVVESFSWTCAASLSQLSSGSEIPTALKSVLTQGAVSVTIANPRDPAMPLVAVSEPMEQITGFTNEEFLMSNGRCIESADIADLGLIGAYASGEPFTGTVWSRRKTGDMFLTFVAVCGLVVAEHVDTGEELWYPVAIHVEASDLADEGGLEDHLNALTGIVEKFRASQQCAQSVIPVADALATQAQMGESEIHPLEWRTLEEPRWRS